MLKKIASIPHIIPLLCLILVAIISISVLSPLFSSPSFHSKSIEIIDNKKLNAMTMSAAVTAASVAISAIPDDVGSSVADELDDLTAVLFAVVCILYLEKYLLTIMSSISFSLLIPLSCLFFGINLYAKKEDLKIWATRFLALSFVFACIVPISAEFTAMLDETFAESINQTFDAVYRIIEDDAEADEDANVFVKFFESVKETVTDVVDAAKKMLSLFVDAVAVLTVTSCIVPLVTIIIFVCLIKTIFRVPMDISKTMLSAHTLIKAHLPRKKASLYLNGPDDPQDHAA